MNIYFGLDALPAEPAWEGAAVTIGVFDGVHLGHQALIARTLQHARTNGMPAIVLTFDRHPAETVRPESAPLYIHTISHRLERLAECGVDHAVLARFDSSLASTPASEFAEQVLVRQLHAKHLILGDDFRFGHGREGNVELLRTMGESHGFEVHVIASVEGAGGVRVSSSYIRECIQAGDMREVIQLMGGAWQWTGTVVRGDGRGTGFGFPTANLRPVTRLLSPAEGVYACRAKLEGRWYAAAVSAGTKPVFPNSPPSIEAYLIDFEHRPLYGCTIDIQFIQFLRKQQAFESTDALLEQIHRDVIQTKDLIK
jgi:riboflavin kinase/FMN adenylyltransferase